MTHDRKQQLLSIEPNYRALYLHQRIYVGEVVSVIDHIRREILQTLDTDSLRYPGYLQLRDVTSITPEEAAKHLYIPPPHDELDYLRSIGIVTDYWHPLTGLVKSAELIEAGIVRLTPPTTNKE